MTQPEIPLGLPAVALKVTGLPTVEPLLGDWTLTLTDAKEVDAEASRTKGMNAVLRSLKVVKRSSRGWISSAQSEA